VQAATAAADDRGRRSSPLVELARDEIADGIERFDRLYAFRFDLDGLADARTQHQQVHDRGGAGGHAVVVDGDFRIEPGGLAREGGRRPRVQAALIHQLGLACQLPAHSARCSRAEATEMLFPSGFLGGECGFGERQAAAHFSQLDQHGQVHPARSLRSLRHP